ncbi:ABC transporter substrate-binding protein [Sphingobium sp.]|uniref:ABC transporter substrate-binding protein n=1 Tax=Sphingobium sp. TaxID=1912891 RepID=UPI0035C6995F
MMHRRVLIAAMALLLMGASAPPEPFVYLLPAPKEAIPFAPFLLAEAEGSYAREGLAVRFEQVAGGGFKVGEALGQGRGDAGGALGDTATILRGRGVPVQGIALLGRHSFLTWMGVKELSIDGGALRGQSIGVPSKQDVTYYALKALLHQVGLTPEDVTVVVAAPDALVAAMARGEIRAMVGTVDWGVRAERAGIALDYRPMDAYYPAMAQAVMASDAAIAGRPRLLARFAQATLRALHGMARHPDRAARRYAALVPRSGYSEAEVARIFTLMARHIYGKGAGPFDALTMERAAQAAVAEGLLPPGTAAEGSFTNRLVSR